MRSAPALLSPVLLLVATAHSTAPPSFQYERPVSTSGTGEACAILDPAIFAHAAPALRDLRLFSLDRVSIEIPYVLTVSEAQQADPDAARVLNLHRSGDSIDFDLAMPPRPYTEVILNLTAQNFLATADVSGFSSAPDAQPVPLGHFTLFDLTAQHLSRNTTLALQESTFPLLHVRLHLQQPSTNRSIQHISPEAVRAATVPPSRDQQVLFETAMATHPQIINRLAVARFVLPQHLPIERVLFRLAPSFTGDMLRTVHIAAQSLGSDPQETTTGSIARVNRDLAGLKLRQNKMSVDATIGANLQNPAQLTVTVDNGPDAPLPITSVELQVRQRKLCFHASGDLLTLAYGDPNLRAPQYPTTPGLSPTAHVVVARLGPEAVNPQWQPRPEEPKSRRRQPHLVWVVLLGLTVLFGVVAVRASNVVSH